jgi:hypothetical protein
MDVATLCHSKFVTLREEKDANDVVREGLAVKA